MLQIALKEWAGLCDLLAEGRQALILRKGGIHEDAGPGCFEARHPRFALWPAWSHQSPEGFRPPYAQALERLDEPEQVRLRAWAEIDHIWLVPHPEALQPIHDLHVWSPSFIDQRWQYKPQQPLWLILLRTQRLHEPVLRPNRQSYSGCRSWFDLDPNDAIDPSASEPVFSPEKFAAMKDRIDHAIMGAGGPSPTSR